MLERTKDGSWRECARRGGGREREKKEEEKEEVKRAYVGICRRRVHEAHGGKWDSDSLPAFWPATPQGEGTLKGSLILEAELLPRQRIGACN